MSVVPEIVALVPLRRGSKRIPGKNIRAMAGKPLAYWVCAAARDSRFIRQVYVSTDDDEIARTVEAFNLGIQVVRRPASLARDNSTTDDVILHFMSQIKFDIVATIQATSPLLSTVDLDLAIEQFQREGADSLVTGVVVKRFFWSLDGRPLNYDPFHRPFSQEFQGSFMENGAFYLTTRGTLEKFQNRLGGTIAMYRMAGESATEIDTPDDWVRVEQLLGRTATFIAIKARRVKMVISDFDGVWTDNKVYSFGNAQEGIRCSKADSLAWDIFRHKFTMPILVVSKEKNAILKSRCEKLNLAVLDAVDDKRARIDRELAARGISWPEVCYIGNDVNDLECMARAGLTFCPSDAAFEVRCVANYILNQPGGDGAIREMLELLGRSLE